MYLCGFCSIYIPKHHVELFLHVLVTFEDSINYVITYDILAFNAWWPKYYKKNVFPMIPCADELIKNERLL